MSCKLHPFTLIRNWIILQSCSNYFTRFNWSFNHFCSTSVFLWIVSSNPSSILAYFYSIIQILFMLLRHLTNKSKQTLGTCCKTFEMIHSTKASTNWIRKRTYFQHEFKYLSSVRYWDKSWIVDYYMGLKPDRRAIECISSGLSSPIYSDKRRMGLNSSFGICSTKFAMKNQPMFWTDIPIQNTTKLSLNVRFDI